MWVETQHASHNRCWWKQSLHRYIPGIVLHTVQVRFVGGDSCRNNSMSNSVLFFRYSRRYSFCVCTYAWENYSSILTSNLTFPVCRDRLGSGSDGGSKSLSSWNPPGDHARFFDGEAVLDFETGVWGIWTGTFTNFVPLRVLRVVASKILVFVAGPGFLSLPMAEECVSGVGWLRGYDGNFITYTRIDLRTTRVIHVYDWNRT